MSPGQRWKFLRHHVCRRNKKWRHRFQNQPRRQPGCSHSFGVSAGLSYAGLAPTFIGVYQFNVVVPNVPASDLVQMIFVPAATQ